MKQPLPLRSLILGSAALFALVLLGLTVFASFEVKRHADDLAWLEHTHSAIERLDEERVQVKNADLARRSERDGAPGAQEAVRRAVLEAGAAAASLVLLTEDNPAQAARAAELLRAPAGERALGLTRTLEIEERRLLAEREARERRSARIAFSALAGEFGLFAGLACAVLWLVLRGLSERERLLAELERTVSSLRTNERALVAANAELDAFAYSIAHDLRAPLRAIDGFTKSLEQSVSASLADEPRHMLARVRANAERMSRLIEDLLQFSRLGRQAAVETEVDMNALARRAAAAAAAAEPGRAVELELGPLPACRGDAAMLAVVWNNLVSNAYKYTRGRSPARIKIGGEARGGTFEYWIEDNGTGFDMAYAGKLFKVFSRLHGHEIEGTGAGLALVRRVIERHGGTVSGEGAVDRGATFRFSLPRREAA